MLYSLRTMSLLRNGSAESDKKKKPFAQGTSVNRKSVWLRSSDTTLPSSDLLMQFTRKKVHVRKATVQLEKTTFLW